MTVNYNPSVLTNEKRDGMLEIAMNDFARDMQKNLLLKLKRKNAALDRRKKRVEEMLNLCHEQLSFLMFHQQRFLIRRGFLLSTSIGVGTEDMVDTSISPDKDASQQEKLDASLQEIIEDKRNLMECAAHDVDWGIIPYLEHLDKSYLDARTVPKHSESTFVPLINCPGTINETSIKTQGGNSETQSKSMGDDNGTDFQTISRSENSVQVDDSIVDFKNKSRTPDILLDNNSDTCNNIISEIDASKMNIDARPERKLISELNNLHAVDAQPVSFNPNGETSVLIEAVEKAADYCNFPQVYWKGENIKTETDIMQRNIGTILTPDPVTDRMGQDSSQAEGMLQHFEWNNTISDNKVIGCSNMQIVNIPEAANSKSEITVPTSKQNFSPVKNITRVNCPSSEHAIGSCKLSTKSTKTNQLQIDVIAISKVQFIENEDSFQRGAAITCFDTPKLQIEFPRSCTEIVVDEEPKDQQISCPVGDIICSKTRISTPQIPNVKKIVGISVSKEEAQKSSSSNTECIGKETIKMKYSNNRITRLIVKQPLHRENAASCSTVEQPVLKSNNENPSTMISPIEPQLAEPAFQPSSKLHHFSNLPKTHKNHKKEDCGLLKLAIPNLCLKASTVDKQLKLTWDMPTVFSRSVPMCCYTLCGYTCAPDELSKVFEWKIIGKMAAKPLPMSCTLGLLSGVLHNGSCCWTFKVEAIDVNCGKRESNIVRVLMESVNPIDSKQLFDPLVKVNLR